MFQQNIKGCSGRLKVPDSQKRFKYGVSDLHLEAANNNAALVSQHIKNGVYVDIRDAGGNTPLHLAARYNSLDAIVTLYKHGADIEAKNNYGQTPLHFAYQAYMLEAAEALRHRGASTKTRDNRGIVPAATKRLRTKKNAPIPLLAGLKKRTSSY